MRYLILSLFLVAGAAFGANVTVTWDAPTTYVDGTPIELPMRYWVKRDGTLVGTLYTETFTETLTAGTYCYTVTAVVNKDGTDFASNPTSPVCTTIEQANPNAPTNVTITVQ